MPDLADARAWQLNLRRELRLHRLGMHTQLERSRHALQASWATLARSQGLVERGDAGRLDRELDRLADELIEQTRRLARGNDDGSILALLAGQRPQPDLPRWRKR
jgi:hypothetical protein